MHIPKTRALCASIGSILILSMSGCQSYEPVPLDLTAHHADVHTRLTDLESIHAFMQRLRPTEVSVPDTFDLSDGMSRAEGEVLALLYNPDLRLARLDAGVALATAENAGLWEDPNFGFDGAEILSSSAPFEFGLMLGVTIPVSGRLEAEKARAGADHEAALRRVVDAEWTLRADVRDAWLDWSVAVERVRLLDDVVARLKRLTVVTDRLERVEELSRVQARLFQVELAEREAELASVSFASQRARLHLLSLMGLGPDTDVDLAPSFETVDSPTVDDRLTRLIESNTALAIERAEYQVAEASLRLEIRKQYPDISLGSGYGNEDDDRLLLGVSLPIPILNANRAGIAEADARRDRARAAAEVVLERLSHQLAVADADLEAAASQRALYESTVLPLLIQQSEDIERVTELGDVDTLLLLEDVSRQLEARTRLLDLRLAESNATNRIITILGPDAILHPAPFRAGGEQ